MLVLRWPRYLLLHASLPQHIHHAPISIKTVGEATVTSAAKEKLIPLLLRIDRRVVFEIRSLCCSVLSSVRSHLSRRSLQATTGLTSWTYCWWVLRFRASTHVTAYIYNLSTPSVYTGTDQIHMVNGTGFFNSDTLVHLLFIHRFRLSLTNTCARPKTCWALLNGSRIKLLKLN